MNERDKIFVQNYPIFGSATGRRYNYTQKATKELKNKLKKEGVYLLPSKKLADKQMPVKENGKNREDLFSVVQFGIASLDPLDQEKIIEMVRNMPDTNFLMDTVIGIQYKRIAIGLKNEEQQGKLLDTTEGAMSNLVGMLQAKHNMEEGQDLNINVNNSISDLLDEVEYKNVDDSDEVTIDISEALSWVKKKKIF